MGRVKMATFDVTPIAAKNRTDSSEIGAHTHQDKNSRPTPQPDTAHCRLLSKKDSLLTLPVLVFLSN